MLCLTETRQHLFPISLMPVVCHYDQSIFVEPVHVIPQFLSILKIKSCEHLTIIKLVIS